MAGNQDKTQVVAPGMDNINIPSGLGNLDPNQLMTLLRSLNVPGVFTKISDQGGSINKEDAAQTLHNLSQSGFQLPPGLPGGAAAAAAAAAAVAAGVEPGPSSHPRGPPSLTQSAGPSGPTNLGVAPNRKPPQVEEDLSDGDSMTPADGPAKSANPRGRGANRAAMGTDEWTRQRKDNHKEVERRRRGNINEGINELGRIVPNGSGEKAKGAILSRAVQYIHHLKENEARNIEKWTLEKLLMDQAMGDLQAQLEEMRRLWDEERTARQRAESELDQLKSGSATEDGKRKAGQTDGERDGKRQRAD